MMMSLFILKSPCVIIFLIHLCCTIVIMTG